MVVLKKDVDAMSCKINAAKECYTANKKLLHAKFQAAAAIWSLLFHSCFLSFVYHHIINSNDMNLA